MQYDIEWNCTTLQEFSQHGEATKNSGGIELGPLVVWSIDLQVGGLELCVQMHEDNTIQWCF